MRVLYIFPHPDDESFGPANVMHMQARQGHSVHLLTLTRGEATKQRLKLGLSPEEMGEQRYSEMLAVEKVLRLSGMRVLTLPDSGLKELAPQVIEDVIEEEINRVAADVVVTYAVHGVSGFYDHLVTHAAVKRVFCKMRGGANAPKRLALYTLDEAYSRQVTLFKLSFSHPEEIDCRVVTGKDDVDAVRRALDCYTTYQEVIDKSGIRNILTEECCFEFFQEACSPPVECMFAGIKI